MKRIISVLLTASMLSTVIAAQSPVGSMGGQFAVNEMGAATYTIPIDVPVGINGMQPDVSLVYNSQNGNGVCGMGFALSTTSMITRVPRSIYYDGAARGVKYDSNDAFVLDGRRLLLESGTNGSDGSVYRLEDNPIIKVTLKGSGSSQYFEVENGGTIIKYGSTTEGRQVLKSAVVCWLVDYVKDVHNSYMSYKYSDTDNYKYLDEIVYGGNLSGPSYMTSKVLFTYETRTDQSQFVINGVKGKLSKRLKSITCTTNTSKYRVYDLTYSTSDGFSRLENVKMKGTDDTYLPATTFVWDKYSSVMTSGTINSFSGLTGYNTGMGVEVKYDYIGCCASDYTSNGTDDIFYLANKTTKTKDMYGGVFCNYTVACGVFALNKEKDGRTYYTKLTEYTLDPIQSFDMIKNEPNGYNFHDFTGNGIRYMTIPYYMKIGKENYAKFKILAYDKKYPIKDIKVLLYNSSEMPVYTIDDFSNDGKSVILYVEKKSNVNRQYSGKFIEISNSADTTLAFTTTSKTFVLRKDPKRLISGDFNGDGMTDLIFLMEDQYAIYWNQGGSNMTNIFSSTPTEYSSFGNSDVVKTGDFNGDGLVDFIANNRNSCEIYFMLSNGDGTFSQKLASSTLDIVNQSFTNKDDDKFDCEVIDYNLDGKSDVIITKSVYKKKSDITGSWGVFDKTYTYWLKSDGEKLVIEKTASSKRDDDGLSNRFLTGDFDGDGYVELMNYGYDCYTSENADMSPQWRVYDNKTASSGKVYSICGDGTKKIDIIYSSLTNGDIYNRAGGAIGESLDIQIPLHVVQSATINNGAAPEQKSDYHYYGLRYHAQGRGVLGFCKVTCENTALGVVSSREITKWNTTYYIPTEICTTTTIGNKSQKDKTTLVVVPKKGKCYWSYLSAVNSTDYDGNVTTTTNTYDTSSYYLKKTRTEYGSSGMYKQTEYSSYVKAGGVLVPQTITATQKHSDDTSPFSRKTSFVYDAKTGDKKQEVENVGVSPITNDYSYDSFGNLISHKISAEGVTSVTTKYVYDNTRRFVTNKKNDIGSVNVTYSFDILGNMLSMTDESSLSTTYSYDAIGNISKIVHPDGTSTKVERGWGSSAAQRYYIKETTTGRAPVTTWYDNCGREVKTETYGEKGMAVSVTKTYGKHGGLTNETTKTGNVTVSRAWSYDSMGRISFIAGTNTPYTTYSYGNRSVRTYDNNNNRAKTTTYDAWGNVTSVKDDVTSITYSYASNGNPSKVTSGGASYYITYDKSGNQASLTDPDAGLTRYSYDVLGRVTESVDAKGIITKNTYDKYGNLTKRVCGAVTTTYTYGTTAATTNQLQKEMSNGQTITYSYDKYGRLTGKTYVIDGESFSFSYTYDASGNISTAKGPIGATESYVYDSYGNVVEIKMAGSSVWKLDSYTGTARNTMLGSTMKLQTTFRSDGFLEGISLLKNNATNSNLMNLQKYTFDSKSGDLTHREGVGSGTEDYVYDKADRLVSVKSGSTVKMSMNYGANGNITNKTSVGAYTYGQNAPHAVNGVSNSGKVISTTPQYVEYTSFNKVSKVSQGSNTLVITYGPNNQRVKTVLTSGTQKTTRVYAGSYERVKLPNGNVIQYQYVDSPDGLVGVYVKENSNSAAMQYALTDHQGSILALYKPDFTTTYTASYDVWGKRTVNKNNISFQRGYTGHEHWDSFQLIDMNGRFYDPILARFLSPDPYVQAPDNTQSFNRYSYCLNNPLKYTDPSGEFWEMVVFGAVYGAIYNGAMSDMKGKGFWKGAWKGALVGAASGALGSIAPMGNKWYGSVGWGSIVGTSSGIGNCWASGCSNRRDYINGAWEGAAIGGAMGFLTCEQFGNLTRGKGFNTNEGVFQNFKNGVYDIPEGSSWQQEALDYFGFEGKYVDQDGNASYDKKSATIRYRNNSFDSYSELKMSYLKESFHKYRHKAGLMSWGDTKYADIDRWPEEYEGAVYMYKSQGLHGNKVGLERIKACESMLNLHNNISYNHAYKFESFRAKWTDFIYKIPRRW